MKLYHIVCGRPIGPTFEAYIEPPDVGTDEHYGIWLEETTLDDLVKQFRDHVVYAKEHFPKSYFPYELKLGIRRGK